MSKTVKVNYLHSIALLVLFITSYIPLFLLVIFRQCVDNSKYLNFVGFSYPSILLFLQKFGLSAFLSLISLLGLVGLHLIIKNLRMDSENGDFITILNVQNRNNESIGYIATYIIPFLYQDFNSIYGCVSFLFLMLVIYSIYTRSNMILVNPLLNFCYSIYEVTYKKSGMDGENQERTALLISNDRMLEEDSTIKIYEIGYKLYFSKKGEKNEYH